MSATGIKRINVNLLLGFVLSFFINSAFAQNLDSLWNIWQNEPMLADTSRINAALSFAKDLTKKQPLRSVELGEAVMKLVDEQARSGVLSDSLAYKFKKRTFNILVIAYSNVGDNQRALEALLANLALAQKKGDKKKGGGRDGPHLMLQYPLQYTQCILFNTPPIRKNLISTTND